MTPPTPTKVLLTTTFAPRVLQLSGALARGVRLMDRFVQAAPTPQKTMTCERERSALLRDVGRHIMAWGLHHMAPEADPEAPSRVPCKGCLSRRRRTHPRSLATLCGPVTLRRRLDEPLGRAGRSGPPFARRLGVEAGWATPALAERVGRWATDHPPPQVLERLGNDHAIHWSCTSLRTVLGSLRPGMAPHRHVGQGERVVHGLEQARASQGRFRPTLAVGRDGIFVPLRPGVWPEGATATVAVVARRGKRVGTVYLGHRPEPGQGTLTEQRSTLLKAIGSRVDSQGRRLVSVTDAGEHPSDSYHRCLTKRLDPRRPWRRLAWRRIVDFYHACQSLQKLADALFGVGAAAQSWAKQMCHVLKTKAKGAARVFQSASALRRSRGLGGQANAYDKAYDSITTRTQWMQYPAYKRQQFPLGSGITEAACQTVFTQRLKRSGLAWTLAGGQGIVALRVIWLSGVWTEAHQQYVAAKPMPVTQGESAKGAQHDKLAA
jgi:hypothetical protein